MDDCLLHDANRLLVALDVAAVVKRALEASGRVARVEVLLATPRRQLACDRPGARPRRRDERRGAWFRHPT